MNRLLKLLLGTGLYLLEQSDGATKDMRDRAADQLSDLRDAAQEKYETASNRVARASRAIRGEDHHVLSNTLRFVDWHARLGGQGQTAAKRLPILFMDNDTRDQCA